MFKQYPLNESLDVSLGMPKASNHKKVLLINANNQEIIKVGMDFCIS